MKLPHEQSLSPACAVSCDLAADATVRAGLESLPELRKHPGSVHGEPVPPSLLKHADEQTVAGLVAVCQALASPALQATDFRDWGVAAAPRFLGRPAMAAALQRFQAEGAWGVSPHLIPHRSLHSLSGTVSQALKIHGPNFGVGGGPGGVAEVLLAATAMLERRKLPGVWVVLTCLDPELAPDESGRPASGTKCVGLALALMPIRRGAAGRHMRLVCGAPGQDSSSAANRAGEFDLRRLVALLDSLRGDRRGNATVVHSLGTGYRIELTRTGMANVFERTAPAMRELRSHSSDSDRGHVVLADS